MQLIAISISCGSTECKDDSGNACHYQFTAQFGSRQCRLFPAPDGKYSILSKSERGHALRCSECLEASGEGEKVRARVFSVTCGCKSILVSNSGVFHCSRCKITHSSILATKA